MEVESGKKDDRPQLQAALAKCRKEKATLVIAKLDRPARDVHFISGLMKQEVDFIAVDNPEANKLTIHIMAAMAEHEREMISKRTKDALAAAKARGVKLGSPVPEKGAKTGLETIKANATQFALNMGAIIQQLRSQEPGITLRGIAKGLNERGVPTARGGGWGPSGVRNVLARL